mgnify:CR=1 FL=1
MSNVRRIYVEKKEPYAVKAKELHDELKNYLGIDVAKVREFIRYDVENISDEVFARACKTVFSEPPVDDLYEETIEIPADAKVFSVEFLPGQFDQRADSAEQCVKFLNENETPVIKTATTYIISGKLTDDDKAKIKNHCINPVDSRETGMEKPDTLVTEFEEPADVAVFDGFMDMDGPMTFSMEHAEVNRHILAHSRKNILLCDSSKFTKTATYQFAKFSDYDVMITNELQEGQQDCVNEVGQLLMVKEN